MICSNVKSLDCIKPISNTLLIKNISDSIEDSTRSVLINVVRNEANTLNEKSIGKIMKVCNTPYTLNQDGKKIDCSDQLLEGLCIVYDTHSRLIEFKIDDDCDNNYYLIRVPDVICALDDYNEE